MSVLADRRPAGRRSASELYPNCPLPQHPALHFLVQSAHSKSLAILIDSAINNSVKSPLFSPSILIAFSVLRNRFMSLEKTKLRIGLQGYAVPSTRYYILWLA